MIDRFFHLEIIAISISRGNSSIKNLAREKRARSSYLKTMYRVFNAHDDNAVRFAAPHQGS